MTRLAALRPVPAQPEPSPALHRFAALAPLDQPAETALALAADRKRRVRPRRDLFTEGAPVTEPLMILGGWAARVRHLEDGRRQIMTFLLPGDLIGHCRQTRPVAVSTVVALTEIIVCPAPAADLSPALNEAYAASQALGEAYLLAHITRLGRMSAEERLVDLFLEFRERLGLCGLVERDGFALPLTQEMLADAVGLTPVHVNRMLQQLRRQGDIIWKAGGLTLPAPAALAARVGRAPVRVSGED